MGKRGDLHARRQALSVVRQPELVQKLFTTLSPRFQSRAGGYVRIVKLGNRPGDGAPVSIIEFLAEGKEGEKKAKARKRREKPKRSERTKLPEAASKPS